MRKLFAIATLLALGFVVQMLIWERVINPYYAQVMTLMGIYVILAVSLNLINGFTGQFSLGHAGFMAVGGYFSAIVTTRIDLGLPWFLEFAIGTLFGATVAAIVGFLIGLPTLRLRGDYLAIATLGFGEIIRVLIVNWEYVGGASGFFGIPGHTNFFGVIIFAVITVVVISNFINSSHGRACVSIREDEIAAETMGIDTTKYKVIAFTMGAFFAGAAGSLFAHFLRLLHPMSFTFMQSIDVLLMVVLGGLGSITGSVAAAVFLTFISEALRKVAELRMIVYSLMLIGIMLFRPQGLLGKREFSLPSLFGKSQKRGEKVGSLEN